MPEMYDVLMGIFRFLPGDKPDFKYDRYEIAEFMAQNQSMYSILKDFNERRTLLALEDITSDKILTRTDKHPIQRMRINFQAVRRYFKKANPLATALSQIDQLRDLSEKFAEEFR